MWIWILLIVVCLLYVYYVSGVCGWVLPVKWDFMRRRDLGVPKNMMGEYPIYLHWINKLNTIIKETQMTHYTFVQELPPLIKADKETLYCLLTKEYHNPKYPFFKVYLLTDDGAYKFIDITKI